ncbi:ABC-type transport auxiliary lipoprotein family protein [Sphingomonas sp. ID1715]|uniref:ABC-type transport auxiliary lipoprotein family protein n=1 Tax=Sphingomonas sp. ID1715 TaxID=1656898 RepID=UPI0034A0820C
MLLVFALSGCISFGEKPPERLLRLTATQSVAPGTGQSVSPGEAITVIPPTVPAELASNRVPVRSGSTEVAYVKKAQWVEPPSRLFARLLSEVIAARTGRPVLSGRQFVMDPGVRVTGQLQAFGIDEASQSAVVTFDAAVARGTAIQTRRFEARVPVSAIEAAPVGAALNQAANQVAAEVADWLK